MKKIDYKKHWGTSGTCYNQTVTIDSNLMNLYNEYLIAKKVEIENNFKIKHTYSENDMKIKSIDCLEIGINYTNLITLDLFMEFYIKKVYIPPKKDKFYERLLWRNTIIKVVEEEKI